MSLTSPHSYSPLRPRRVARAAADPSFGAHSGSGPPSASPRSRRTTRPSSAALLPATTPPMVPLCCLTSCTFCFLGGFGDGRFARRDDIEACTDPFLLYSNNETMVLSEKYLPTIKKTFTGGVMPVSSDSASSTSRFACALLTRPSLFPPLPFSPVPKPHRFTSCNSSLLLTPLSTTTLTSRRSPTRLFFALSATSTPPQTGRRVHEQHSTLPRAR